MPGEIIVREGEPGEEFFLVADGAVHVLGRGFDDTDLVLARLEAGSCFGEQALLEDRPFPRSASVRSATRCRLLVLPRHALGRALDKDEQILALLRRDGRDPEGRAKHSVPRAHPRRARHRLRLCDRAFCSRFLCLSRGRHRR